ncbi:MAG: putative metal-binding motif-containing protein [Myxococcota bacterium]
MRWWLLLMVGGCDLLGSDPDRDETLVASSDLDGDGFTVDQGDCDDTDPQLSPGAIETCDGVDQDCNGTVDDNPSDGTTYYRDDDQDDFGDDDVTRVACARPEGFALVGGDCDDTDPDVNPDAEDPPGEDTNCDGVDGPVPDPTIGAFDVECMAGPPVRIRFDVTVGSPVARGIVYLADTGFVPAFGDEHDLFPVAPDGDGLDAELTQELGISDIGGLERNSTTIFFSCDQFFDAGIMTYAVAIYDDADTLLDCVVTGSDPGDFLTGTFPETGLEPSFDTTSCREIP